MKIGVGLALTRQRSVPVIVAAQAGDGFAAALATADAIGTGVVDGVGLADGLATADGFNTALAPGAGASDGLAAVTGAGSGVLDGAGAVAAGTVTATATGEATAASAGDVPAGTVTATAVGSSGGGTVTVQSTSSLSQAAGRTTSTVTAPTGITNGDLLVCFFDAADPTAEPSLAITPPSGWAEATNSPIEISKADPYTHGFRIYWKAANNESGNYAFTHASAETEAFMYRISGANTTTPFSPAPTVNEGNGQTTTALGLTTPANNCLVIMAEMLWDDTVGMTVPTGSTPTFTQRYAGGGMYVCDGVLATAGATGNKSHTNGNNSGANPWAAYLVCVQPA